MLVIGCVKLKEKVLSSGNMFIRKKIQPILRVEVVKYVSLLINGGKISKWFQDQIQWLEQPKIENCEESDIEKKKIKEILSIT